jgi:hypothetical protein
VVDNNEPNLASGGLGGNSPAEGTAASAMGNSVVNSRLSVDLTMLRGLNEELTKLDGNVKKIKDKFKALTKEAKDLTAQLNKAATAMGKVGEGSSSAGYLDTSRGMPPAATAPPPGTGVSTEAADALAIMAALGIVPPGAATAAGAAAGAAGSGGASKNVLQKFVGSKGFAALQEGIAAIDDRVDRNKQYALPADRLSVVLQQQYNMSQGQVQRDLRDPLRQYKLGYGGINELLALQSRTGLNARMQASSVESLRALTGYAASAKDVTGYIESMAQADTVNRMFMMTGTSMYGIGGTQKSAMQVNQELIERLGLNNREILQGARQSGSVLRQRLSMSGMDEGAQDMLLQYAESNISFRERGGEGYYDPSNKTHRNVMGIEGNYATQEEETTRTEVSREEQMYKRQADNYAQMEKNLQATNKALEKFEDFLSSIIGARTSMRGNPIAKMTQMLGMGLAPFFPQIGIPLMAIGGVLGDGGEGGGTGRIQAQNPTAKVRVAKQTSLLSQLKPTLRDPLERLMEDRPGITIMQGGAYRSPQTQEHLFKSRYVKTDKKTNTYYEDSYWEKKPGATMTAPPGLSYHEIGLAADLSFASREDMAWLQQNARKYGLDEFSRHDEPWHVQPSVIPASRRDYEEGGASHGTDRGGIGKYVSGTTGETRETSPQGQNAGQMTSGIELSAVIQSQLSIAESMASFASERQVITFNNSPEGNYSGFGGGVGGSSPSDEDNKRGGGHGKTDEERKKYYRRLRNKRGENRQSSSTVADKLRKVMVRGRKLTEDEISNFTQIVRRETGGTYDANAYNDNFDTGDLSFGLLQLNLLGNNKFDLFKKFPQYQKDYSGLWDPQQNIEVAAGWLMADGLTPNRNQNIYYHWGGDVDDPLSGKSGFKAKLGDPSDYAPKPMSVGSPATAASTKAVTNNTTFNINPVINVASSGSERTDAAKLAKEVAKLIDREIKILTVRTS